MKPQKQLFGHNPDAGVYGDCFRTSIACVLDMDAADVPHFMDGTTGLGEAEAANDKAEVWLNARGLCTINVLFPGEIPIELIMETVANCNVRSRPAFMLGGTSKSGVNHVVVCCDGVIACDPSHADAGIVGPMDDGYYWVTFFGALVAAHPTATTKGNGDGH